ncbi:TnpV protein [Negativibacillus massiliensis]|uniref:TnpV protein n=1 Tax=Negativibacillus massiliensis TaxID=1871035 RepID=UPI003AF647B2
MRMIFAQSQILILPECFIIWETQSVRQEKKCCRPSAAPSEMQSEQLRCSRKHWKKKKGVSTMPEITYRRMRDYQIPELELPKSSRLGRFGRMREQYLKQEHSGIYTELLLMGELDGHLREIEQRATEQMELIISQMVSKEGLSEELKATDQMEWIRRMNSIRQRAEEMVKSEIIYS